MWGRLIMQGPPQETLSSFAILSCWELWGATSRWRPTHSGRQTPPTWGPGVTPHHVTAPCDVIIGFLPPPSLKGLLRQDPGKQSQTGALPRLQVSELGWAGLGGGGGVSGFSPGWMAIFGVGCSTYSHSSQSKEALGSAGAGAVGGISHPSTGRLWVLASSPRLASCSSQGGLIQWNGDLTSTS